jgi:hypothetical protein
VLFNRLAAVCEPRSMSVKGWNTAKVRFDFKSCCGCLHTRSNLFLL